MPTLFRCAARPAVHPPVLPPLPATLATAALAVLASLVLAALGGCDGTAAPAAPLRSAGVPQPAPTAATGCGWLRQVDALDGTLVLDYRARTALADGGQLQQHHAAEVGGRLRLVQRSPQGAVWAGALRDGRLALHDQQAGAAPRWLDGEGPPAVGPGLAGSALTLRVDFADCSLRYAARLALAATDARPGRRHALPRQELGWLGLSGLATSGGPVLAGQWQLPAVAPVAGAAAGEVAVVAGQALGRYVPGGLARPLAAAPAGMALLRWRFAPAGTVPPADPGLARGDGPRAASPAAG